jgi:hypothetical protein
MRFFGIAMTVVGLVSSMAAPAAAQGMGHGGRHKRTQQKTETPGVKANDRDYKAALDRVPPPTQKYDPWGTLRPANDKH